MTKTQALKEIKRYFSFHSEASSWVVDTGVFTYEDTKGFDDETIVLLGEDLEEQTSTECQF